MLAGAAVILVFVAIAVAYVFVVPPLQNADEIFHLRYAQLIATHLQLPGARMTEKQQPPLYYLLGALILKAGGSLTALRLMSVVFGATTIGLVMAAAYQFLPGRRGVALGAGIITAALPITASVSASCSDDVLAWAAGAGLLWCLARILRGDPPGRGMLVLCSSAAGIGLLSKETDWILVATLAVAVALRMRRPLRALDVVAAALPALGIAGWWFVRNIVAFHSLVPPLEPLSPTHPILRSAGQLEAFASGAVRSIFGPERPDGGPLPRNLAIQILMGILFSILALSLLAAAGLAARGWRARNPGTRRIAIWVTAICAVLLVEWVLNSVFISLQPQARYLFVAIAVPATAISWLIANLARRLRTRYRLQGWTLACGAIGAFCWVGIDSIGVAATRLP